MLNNSSTAQPDPVPETPVLDTPVPEPALPASALSAAHDPGFGATAETPTSPDTPSRRRRGRRPAGADTRTQILNSARRLFAANGYTKVSLRAIARDADVDPALVHHYFHGKPAVFFATIADSGVNPVERLGALELCPRSELGRELVLTFLGIWDDAAARGSLQTLLHSAEVPEQAVRPLREFFTQEVLARIPALDADGERDERGAELAASQILGMAMMRYVFQLDHYTKASPEELADWIGACVQQCLDGLAPATLS
ncbi:TetR/AcrR family transcriptional regulator [Luteococcus sp. Sow4_B9]|uniref:TetR/AcrR family transcriptional regulator n=1 Tax=Luteococcus sp. Sow4_B9 TaxID=3438792 RepID=UPI003F99AB36